MKCILVANPKGGAGKSTLATNLAGYFAACGHRVALGDLDSQQSSADWLGLRALELSPIASWDLGDDEDERLPRPPDGTTHAVLDSPAGINGKRLEHALKAVDQVIVPVLPSMIDILATRKFLEKLLREKSVRKGKTFVAVVGMRVDARTHAASELARFFEQYEMPVLTYLRDTQHYVQASAQGMSLFDFTPASVRGDLGQWQPIIEWVDGE